MGAILYNVYVLFINDYSQLSSNDYLHGQWLL